MWFMAPGLIKNGKGGGGVLDHLNSHKLIKKDLASRNYWSYGKHAVKRHVSSMNVHFYQENIVSVCH
jgi:hypothetical protein